MRRFYGYGWREFWLHATLGEICALLTAITPPSGGADGDADPLAAMGL